MALRDPLRFHWKGQNPTPVVTGDYTSGWRLFKKVLGLFKSRTPGGDAKTARFYAEQWAKEHPGAEFDPNKYTDEQILHAFHNGAFSKTAGDRLDPLQLLGIITVFRGGPTLVARPMDIKIDKTTGLVQPGRGVSVSSDAAGLQRFGGAYKVESIPDELELIDRGQSSSHFEIAPRQAMTPQRYQELLNQVKLTRVPQ